ncbi:arylsulfatase [Hephaestia sp. GCM10023244]|uniref:arylsulfatase n=1 Tax=unclassified Hephaestia TaxID=2631281 RepID=UPI0020778EDC|nr:arylsulfatase [Hephaestia sp. MAHUQ-44]MCM8732447.1 arylsulfatase [Hephaestia sp. MAHUQ-44]
MFKKTASKSLLLAGLAAIAQPAAAQTPPQPAPTPAPSAQRPNIIVILVDDMGFSDISSYGSEIPTPNIDALANSGLRFTQFYNTARCSSSRAALLTGTYPHQAGVGHLEAISVSASKGLQGKLLNRVVTMGEVLRSAGYFTAMSGKWHLGMSHGVNPWDRGFDRSMTSATGGLYFPGQPHPGAKFVFIDGKKTPTSSPEVGSGQWYSSDMFVDWGVKFIHEAQQQQKPFFLYLPFVGVHFPLMAPAEDVARFRGKYREDWDKLRRERFERQKAMGLIGKNEVLPGRLPNTYNWDKLSPEDQDRFDKIMAVYAASLVGVDKAVGTLVTQLKQTGQFDNTLILFVADNGGNAEEGPDGRLENAEILGGPKSTTFAGMNWATLQNTPFQHFKHHTEEGGIATPLIAHWPKGIDAGLDGSFVRTPGHLIDILPTVVQVAGATYPTIFNGHEIVPMQGRSFAPAFRGQMLHRDQPIFWEHEGNRAVRDGKWKLVARFRQPWQLFDMSHDRTETRDLAGTNPTRVIKMANQWDKWAEASDVDPWSESYDVYLNGAIRQNWGTQNMPRHPEAMDEMTPLLRSSLAKKQ